MIVGDRQQDLSGKHVVVVGLGKSGIAAAKLCRARGARVTGTDAAGAAALNPELGQLGIEVVLGGHDGVEFTRADLVVVSPGVPRLPELAGCGGCWCRGDRGAGAGLALCCRTCRRRRGGRTARVR